jgi:Haem-binding domain
MTTSLHPRDTFAAWFAQTPLSVGERCCEALADEILLGTKNKLFYVPGEHGTTGDECKRYLERYGKGTARSGLYSSGRNCQGRAGGAMRDRTLSTGATVAALAVAAFSFIHPWGNLRSGTVEGGAILAGANIPDEVRTVLARKCGDCHSNNTRWPLYSKIAPTSWLVEHDVHEGREHLNLSSWEKYNIDGRIDLLGRVSTQIRQGKMPLKQYLLLHPDARLSESERKLIVEWTKVERKHLVVEADDDKPPVGSMQGTEMK